MTPNARATLRPSSTTKRYCWSAPVFSKAAAAASASWCGNASPLLKCLFGSSRYRVISAPDRSYTTPTPPPPPPLPPPFRPGYSLRRFSLSQCLHSSFNS